jgi:hypothetical protein
MALKRLPVLDAFRWGLAELARHLKFLLPLSLLFFVPDFCGKLGMHWPAPLSTLYGTIFFFALLLKAMRLSQPKKRVPEAGYHQPAGKRRLRRRRPKARPLEFAKGELIKWAFQLSAGLLGLGLASLCLGIFSLSPSALRACYDQASPAARIGAAFLILAPAVLVHVHLNFFGYILADKGGAALAALRQSSKLGRGLRLQLLFFYALCAGFILLGLKLWIIGAVYAFPVTVLATIYVYRALAKKGGA